ncbi:uncharacterized protein [Drosophila bipectinata]|uniref:uncharacterized protein n=1 Tax=Drosophila bipectinata TaxID=42026 RepID=UPI001C891719|nr:uncharacterized protein LOC122321534 [Drosophila bipectinata]
MFTLLMVLPLRMVLYATHLYLQNLSYLSHMIEIVLVLLSDKLLLASRKISRRIMHTPRRERRIPDVRNLFLLLIIHDRIIAFIIFLQNTVDFMTKTCYVLNRLSKIFGVCSHRRTWKLMLHDSGII